VVVNGESNVDVEIIGAPILVSVSAEDATETYWVDAIPFAVADKNGITITCLIFGTVLLSYCLQ